MKSIIYVTLVCASIFYAGCAKNPVKDHHGEHNEAVGLVILRGNEEWVRYQDGNVTGSIYVKSGTETPLLSIRFIDEHEGSLFTPAVAHSSLAWTIADPSIAEAKQNLGDDPWSLRIVGKAVGTTSIEIKIMHGDHADFVSLPIPIIVN